MTSFNFNRFLNVARWDLAINRSFYNKVALMVASVITLPVLMKYINILCLRTTSMDQLVPDGDIVMGQASYMVFFIPIIMTVLVSYTFHNLLTRQGRINELTLPASNLERFLWHTLFTILGGMLLILCSVVLADLIHVLLGWSVAGQHHFESLTGTVLSTITFPFREIVRTPGYVSVCVCITLLLGVVIHLSIFVLGNAVVYKFNLAITILWLIAISLCMSVLMGFVVSFCIGHEVHVESLVNLLEHITKNGAATFALLGSLAVTSVLWWLIYRFYRRAQITSRRNS